MKYSPGTSTRCPVAIWGQWNAYYVNGETSFPFLYSDIYAQNNPLFTTIFTWYTYQSINTHFQYTFEQKWSIFRLPYTLILSLNLRSHVVESRLAARHIYPFVYCWKNTTTHKLKPGINRIKLCVCVVIISDFTCCKMSTRRRPLLASAS